MHAQELDDVVRDRIFKPAGMRSTASEPEDAKVPGRSVGYTKGDGTTWKPNTDTLPYRGTPAGGGYSTVEDLERFALALENHVLLDAEHTALLVTPKPIEGSRSQYAYGIGNEDLEGLTCFGHGGGAPGMNGALSICPKDGYVIVVLSNLDPPAAEREGKWLAAPAGREPPRVGPGGRKGSSASYSRASRRACRDSRRSGIDGQRGPRRR